MSFVKKSKSYLIVFILIFSFITLPASRIYAQYATTKVRSVHEAYTDSLKKVEYDYIFPFLGQGAYKKGFDIPYPVGIMANYIWLKQGLIISNFQLGLETSTQDIPLTNVDFIGFGDNTNTSYTVNVRPDIWLLPFLNVYGVFGYGNSETEVNVIKPINLSSAVKQNISTAGIGTMVAFGLGPVWFSVDANWTWNKPELLDKAVYVSVLGVRMGHTFVFKRKPDRNFAIWIGGMRAKMSSETVGQIQLSEAIPGLEGKADQISADYNAWKDANYNDLTAAQKIIVNNVLDPIAERIDEVDGSAIIKYGMDKQVAQLWNGLIGAQFQFNKHWIIRSEAGVIGDRKSILASVNYRFLF